MKATRQHARKAKAKYRTRAPGAEARRRKAIDEILGEVLLEKPARVSAAKLLESSRR